MTHTSGSFPICMTRRAFLAASAALAAAGVARVSAQTMPAQRVMTVGGPVSVDELGVTLAHEHLLVDFIGADRATPDRYDRDEVVRIVLPHLKRAAELGCRTLIDCTPAYLGRDVTLLRRLSDESGVRVVTNTGYYGAGADFKFLPAHAKTESADELAARWINEFERGIDGSDVRPGFIKIGVNKAPLQELHHKLVTAAARTHRKTGLAIASHTGDGAAALEQLDILRAERVEPSAFIWVHAQGERDPALHAKVGDAGAWLSFDGISPKSLDRHVELVRAAKQRGQLSRVVISHDAGWYRPGEPNGGNFRPFDTLFTSFLPKLRETGFTDDEIRQLTITNPADALAIRAPA